jgi:mono/diheme cytochrome c family protein
MSMEASRTSISTPADTGAKATTFPIWLIILMFLLLWWGGVYFDDHSGWFQSNIYGPYRSTEDLALYQPRHEGPDWPRGQQVFGQICALCHGPDGTGKPGQGPPFVGSEFALGDPKRLIRIPLYGLSGTVQVKGQAYVGLSMGAMGATLSSEDLAAVLSYIRNSWGNKAEPVTAAQVDAVRKEVGNRSPFTVDELNAVK